MPGLTTRTNTTLAALLLVAALLACKSKPQCSATVTLAGKTGQGNGQGEEEAAASACLFWCSTHDPGLDAAHANWKRTERGQRSKETRFGEMYTMPNGSSMMKACKQRCLSSATRGQNLQIACK